MRGWITARFGTIRPAAQLGALLAIVLVSGLLGWMRQTNGIDWGDDWAGYVLQARALAEGTVEQSVALNEFTIRNSPPPLGPVAYPWGYPILLSFIYHWAGFNLAVLKGLSLGLLLVTLPALFYLFKGRLQTWEALLLAALVGFNDKVLDLADHLLSDIPFLLASIIALIAIDRLVIRTEHPDPPFKHGSLIGAAIFAASAVRINGLVLLLALGVGQLTLMVPRLRAGTWNWGKQWPLVVAPYTVFGVLFAGLYLALPDGGVTTTLSLEAQRELSVFGTAGHYLSLLAQLYEPLQYGSIVYGFTLALFVVGLVTTARRDLHLLVYAVVMVAILVPLPFIQGFRYLLPIVPFYWYFTIVGAGRFLPRTDWPERILALLPILFVSGVAAYFLFVSVREGKTNLENNRYVVDSNNALSRPSRAMFEFISQHAKPGEAVIFFKPRVLSLFTGIHSKAATDCNELNSGDYVVVHKYMQAIRQVSPEKVPECFDGYIAFNNWLFTVYRKASP